MDIRAAIAAMLHAGSAGPARSRPFPAQYKMPDADWWRVKQTPVAMAYGNRKTWPSGLWHPRSNTAVLKEQRNRGKDTRIILTDR